MPATATSGPNCNGRRSATAAASAVRAQCRLRYKGPLKSHKALQTNFCTQMRHAGALAVAQMRPHRPVYCLVAQHRCATIILAGVRGIDEDLKS